MSELSNSDIPMPVHISTGTPRTRRLSIAAMAALVLGAQSSMAMRGGALGMDFSSPPRRETKKSQDIEKIEKARMKRQMRANKLLKQKPCCGYYEHSS